MITVYGYPKSRATRITWVLEELGLEYHYHLVNLMKGEGKSPEYLAINPSGKVPAMRDDDMVMTESAAIVTYLADKHSAAGLIPKAGSRERAKYEQWSYFVLSELEQPLWTIGKHKFALPAERRVPAIFETAAWEFQRALQLFADGLGANDYILGETFSAVDVLLCHTLIWGVSFEQPVGKDNLRAYMARVTGRAAPARARDREEQALEAIDG